MQKIVIAELGEWLKHKRQKSGKSQTEIARSVGYSSGQLISNIERGRTNPSDEALVKLCKRNHWNYFDVIDILLKARKRELTNLHREIR